MDLITPAIGQIVWGGLAFLILLLLLAKFAWKTILKSVNDREEAIQTAIVNAEKTNAEMKQLQAQNESLLKEARAERDKLIKDASDTSKKLIEDAREEAKRQHDKIVADAQKVINAEKAAAIADLKMQVASLSIEIAEKVIQGELSSVEKQKQLAEKLADDVSLN